MEIFEPTDRSSASITSSTPNVPVSIVSHAANAQSLSITYEEDISEKQKEALDNVETINGNDNVMIESMTNLIPPNARTNQQPNTDNDGWKLAGKHYRKAFHGAHASFRLRMLQEQRIQPSFITKVPNIRRQKLDELQYDDLDKSKFELYAIRNRNEIFRGWLYIYILLII